VRDYLITYSDSALTCQFPSFMTDHVYTNLMWSEYSIVETAFEVR